MECPVCSLPVEKQCLKCHDLFCSDCVILGICEYCLLKKDNNNDNLDEKIDKMFNVCKKCSGRFVGMVVTASIDGWCWYCFWKNEKIE